MEMEMRHYIAVVVDLHREISISLKEDRRASAEVWRRTSALLFPPIQQGRQAAASTLESN